MVNVIARLSQEPQRGLKGCGNIIIRCSKSRNKSKKQRDCGSHPFLVKIKSVIHHILIISLILILQAANSQQQSGASSPKEYQLIERAGEEAHLPCLIGRQLHCGEPYFIAWYKLNNTSKAWARIEHKSEEELLNGGSEQTASFSQSNPASSLSPRLSFNERIRFTWTRNPSASGSLAHQLRADRFACERQQYASDSRLKQRQLERQQFDCAQLTINALELLDEGQYKCEVTFSESLDFEKCPPTTLSQLNVIARPNEPELLVNGRPAKESTLSRLPLLTFKEGAQVRLECQSSGGKPSPKIEWLNVSNWQTGDQEGDKEDVQLLQETSGLSLSNLQLQPEVQLMRIQWPQKKSTYSLDSSALAPNGSFSQFSPTSIPSQSPIPITSSSVTFSLSRFDLRSQFVCLVIPQVHYTHSSAAASAATSLEQLLRSQTYLKALLRQQEQQRIPLAGSNQAPMLKWIKLDVQVKPSSVSLLVRDLETNESLQPVQWHPSSGANQFGGISSNGLIQHQFYPFYSLKLNHLYAIQCLVENSRPQSQVAWFNRTSQIGAEAKQLNESDPNDYSMPKNELEFRLHRLSSYTRSIAQPDGTFRTTASLLLTTNVWDNLEEFFCRVSNEAFQFDELIQVAPIISTRLYVNYPPLAWLELAGGGSQAGAAEVSQQQQHGGQVNSAPRQSSIVQLSGKLGSSITMRCYVAANPLGQNTIIQIEWLKDGRKLAADNSTLRQQQGRLHIEKANHLHMPLQPNGQSMGPMPASQLVAGSKFIGSSSLTIASLSRADSGSYNCHFKLIPAPSSGTQSLANINFGGGQQQQQIRIVSGQANQTMQVTVIEAKLRSPTLRISSQTKRLLVYGLQTPSDGSGRKLQRRLTVVTDSKTEVSFKCDFSALPAIKEFGHKVMWFVNGDFLHATTSDVYNLSLTGNNKLGSFSCAHHLLESLDRKSSHMGVLRAHNSWNKIDLKVKVGPKLLTERRDLMPAARSYSELELGANSANKLKLACLAQCEPLCSIDWYLNQRPLSGLGSNGNINRQQQASIRQATASSANSSSYFVYRSVHELDAGGLVSGSLVSVENLIHRPNESALTWLRQASISQQQVDSTDLLASQSRQLIQEAAEASQQSSANVFSKLELTYNQISQLLDNRYNTNSNSENEELVVKCKLNAMLYSEPLGTRMGPIEGLSSNENASPSLAGNVEPPMLGHALVEPMRWFPDEEEEEGAEVEMENVEDTNSNLDNDQRHRFSMSHEPLNLTALHDIRDSEPEIGNESNGGQVQPNDQFGSAEASSELQQRNGKSSSSLSADEMQISIFLDKPPKSVSVSFAGIVSTTEEQNGLTLSESQLLEFTDPNNKVKPILQCQAAGNPYPPTQFKWTFTDMNQTEHALTSGPQLNLRQLIELRQRQLNVNPMSAYGIEVVTGISGNYSCSATNIHGSKSATLRLQIQGRPLCKLTLAAEFNSINSELMANIRCSIYSMPPLLEILWLRNNKRLTTNKSSLDSQLSVSSWSSSPITLAELHLMVLNKEQEFTLTDVVSQQGNLKCLPRNSLGYSEACELNSIDKQRLFDTFKSNGDSRHPAWFLFSFTDTIRPYNNRSGLAKTTFASLTFFRDIFVHVDSLLLVAFLVSLLWLVFALSRASFRRRFGKTQPKTNAHTSWRYNSSSEIVSNPYQSEICVNYYGDSNGDSEHDMMHSCSQSSHYEDFVQHQLQSQQAHNQQAHSNAPLAQNSFSGTGNRRAMKTSLSSCSTGYESESFGCRKGYQGFPRMAEQVISGRVQTSTLRDFGVLHQQQHQRTAKSASTKRESSRSTKRRSQGLGMVVTNNVPLVNGVNNSRINLDSTQYQPQGDRFNRDQQTFGSQPKHEHIYDDVIQNQIIL